MRKKYNAFTLIELLIVIVIIGILAGLIIFALRSATLKARDARAKNSVRSVQTALETYLTDNANFSAMNYCSGYTGCEINAQFLSDLKDATDTQLLTSIPLDGQNNPVRVRLVGTNYGIRAESAYTTVPPKCWWVSSNKSNLAESKANRGCGNYDF